MEETAHHTHQSAGPPQRYPAPGTGKERSIAPRHELLPRQSGLTLVELMVVVTIIGIVLAIAALSFTQWNDKYTVERYTKEIYSILMQARNDAANSAAPARVTIAANQIVTHLDTNDNGAIEAGEATTTTPLPRFLLISTVLGGLPTTIVFAQRGVTTDIQTLSIPERTAAYPAGYSPSASPGVDCVVVSQTRINMGKMTGVTCVQQ